MDNIPIDRNRVQQAFPAEKQNKKILYGLISGSFVIHQLYLVKNIIATFTSCLYLLTPT